MKFTLALAQCAHPADGDVVALVRTWAARAKAEGADMLMFPESLSTPFELPTDEFIAAAQPADGPFARAVEAIAREQGLWIVYTLNEENPAGGKPFNTLLVCDSEGVQRARYRKVHLFNVENFRESDKMSAGDVMPMPLKTPFCTLGLAICYDLRFAELSRPQALAGCELMVYPAAWVDGPGKVEQWHTLLRARAIENGMYVAGLSRCGAGYVGHSLVVGPTGEAVAAGGVGEELVCCEIDTDRVAAARAAMPTLAHRRTDLY